MARQLFVCVTQKLHKENESLSGQKPCGGWNMAGVAGWHAIGKFGEIAGIFILARCMKEAS